MFYGSCCCKGSFVTWTAAVSLIVLYVLCRASPCPALWTFAFPWIFSPCINGRQDTARQKGQTVGRWLIMWCRVLFVTRVWFDLHTAERMLFVSRDVSGWLTVDPWHVWRNDCRTFRVSGSLGCGKHVCGLQYTNTGWYVIHENNN
jgi:hypothetical protein